MQKSDSHKRRIVRPQDFPSPDKSWSIVQACRDTNESLQSLHQSWPHSRYIINGRDISVASLLTSYSCSISICSWLGDQSREICAQFHTPLELEITRMRLEDFHRFLTFFGVTECLLHIEVQWSPNDETGIISSPFCPPAPLGGKLASSAILVYQTLDVNHLTLQKTLQNATVLVLALIFHRETHLIFLCLRWKPICSSLYLYYMFSIGSPSEIVWSFWFLHVLPLHHLPGSTEVSDRSAPMGSSSGIWSSCNCRGSDGATAGRVQSEVKRIRSDWTCFDLFYIWMWVKSLYQWTSRLMVIPYTTWLVGFGP